MPKTSRALLAVQAVLVALQMLASATTIGDLLPVGVFPVFVLIVGAGQAAFAFYQHSRSTMTGPMLAVLTGLAGLQALSSGSTIIADLFPAGSALPVLVIVVGALQAAAAFYARAVTSTEHDPEPDEPGRLASYRE